MTSYPEVLGALVRHEYRLLQFIRLGQINENVFPAYGIIRARN